MELQPPDEEAEPAPPLAGRGARITCQEKRQQLPGLRASFRLHDGGGQAGRGAAKGPRAAQPPEDIGQFVEELEQELPMQEVAVHQPLPDMGAPDAEEEEWEQDFSDMVGGT